MCFVLKGCSELERFFVFVTLPLFYFLFFFSPILLSFGKNKSGRFRNYHETLGQNEMRQGEHTVDFYETRQSRANIYLIRYRSHEFSCDKTGVGWDTNRLRPPRKLQKYYKKITVRDATRSCPETNGGIGWGDDSVRSGDGPATP